MRKINTDVIRHWVITNLQKLLPDDDVAAEFICELLLGAEEGRPDIQTIREQLTDFVGKQESDNFCLELWLLLLDAQKNARGLPTKLVEERARKLEKNAETEAQQTADHILLVIRAESGRQRTVRGQVWKNGRKLTKERVSKNKTNYNHI